MRNFTQAVRLVVVFVEERRGRGDVSEQVSRHYFCGITRAQLGPSLGRIEILKIAVMDALVEGLLRSISVGLAGGTRG